MARRCRSSSSRERSRENVFTSGTLSSLHRSKSVAATLLPVLPLSRIAPSDWPSLPLLVVSLLFIELLFPTSILAQEAAPDTSQPSIDRPTRVYLDCDECFESYIRRNLKFVDYVRDRKQADVHVLGTRRSTGGGGSTYRLEFIGRGPFEDQRYELRYQADPTQTREERRQGLADRLRLGLVPFVNQTPKADYLEVTYNPPEGDDASASPTDDPWNQWVFDIGLSGSADVQEQEYAYELEGDLGAERITEAWKTELSLTGEQEVDVFEQDDTTDIRSTSEDYEFDAVLIKTLGPNSGTGLSGSVFSRTFTNIQVATRLRAAAEYNLFPYAISDQKRLTVTYRFGPEYRNYREVTIFGRDRETLLRQSAEVSLRLNRTWGFVFASLGWANYFHDLSKNSIEFRSFLDIQLVEGLSLRLSLDAERIQDQLSLPAGDLSDEEVLLRRRQRATAYEFGGRIGLSYTFGSIYNNVVNTRL